MTAPLEAPAAQHNRALFDDHWQHADAQPQDPGDLRRIATIVDLCPTVASVLDVGCGNGAVLHALEKKAALRAGCDGSGPGVRAAAALGVTIAVQASVDRLPFADRAFELVTCCDVLEHLPEPVYLATLQELMRVTSRYLLINVPLDEDLAWSLHRCVGCGEVFHRDHHQRSFRPGDIDELLPAHRFRRLARQTTGWKTRRLGPLPPRLGAALALGHSTESRCPRCGQPPGPLPPLQRRLRDGLVFAHNALTRPLRGRLTRDTEVVALYQRL